MLELKINLDKFTPAMNKNRKLIPKALERIIKNIAFVVERKAKEHLYPGHGKKKGRLRASIRAHTDTAPKFFVWVGAHTEYAEFIERGIAPSPGRYVPALGKRLVNPNLPGFGMHPGFPGIFYMKEGYEQGRVQAQKIAHATLAQIFGRS